MKKLPKILAAITLSVCCLLGITACEKTAVAPRPEQQQRSTEIETDGTEKGGNDAESPAEDHDRPECPCPKPPCPDRRGAKRRKGEHAPEGKHGKGHGEEHAEEHETTGANEREEEKESGKDEEEHMRALPEPPVKELLPREPLPITPPPVPLPLPNDP